MNLIVLYRAVLCEFFNYRGTQNAFGASGRADAAQPYHGCGDASGVNQELVQHRIKTGNKNIDLTFSYFGS